MNRLEPGQINPGLFSLDQTTELAQGIFALALCRKLKRKKTGCMVVR
jgi:hypothetical protein